MLFGHPAYRIVRYHANSYSTIGTLKLEFIALTPCQSLQLHVSAFAAPTIRNSCIALRIRAIRSALAPSGIKLSDAAGIAELEATNALQFHSELLRNALFRPGTLKPLPPMLFARRVSCVVVLARS